MATNQKIKEWSRYANLARSFENSHTNEQIPASFGFIAHLVCSKSFRTAARDLDDQSWGNITRTLNESLNQASFEMFVRFNIKNYEQLLQKTTFLSDDVSGAFDEGYYKNSLQGGRAFWKATVNGPLKLTNSYIWSDKCSFEETDFIEDPRITGSQPYDCLFCSSFEPSQTHCICPESYWNYSRIEYIDAGKLGTGVRALQVSSSNLMAILRH
jgi:hypothetical protein